MDPARARFPSRASEVDPGNVSVVSTPVESLAGTLDELADRVQLLADRAVPTANRIAAVIRIGGALGFLGGLAGAVALALPGFGITRSWGFFLLLLALVVVCSGVVFRWAALLRAWTGEVRGVVRTLQDLPEPAQVIDRLRGSVDVASGHAKSGRRRSAIVSLVKTGTELRNRLKDLPGAADKARDVFVDLTGPFRPPLVAMRFFLLLGGLSMIVVGPVLVLIAAIT